MDGSDMVLAALKYYGSAAIPGADSNPIIVHLLQSGGGAWVHDDETPWCSAFMNVIAQSCALESTKSLSAQSWLKVGAIVTAPEFGDVVIFERGAKGSGFGHVGIVIAVFPGVLYVLGGNQNNMVDVAGFLRDRVLGFRRLRPQS